MSNYQSDIGRIYSSDEVRLLKEKISRLKETARMLEINRDMLHNEVRELKREREQMIKGLKTMTTSDIDEQWRKLILDAKDIERIELREDWGKREWVSLEFLKKYVGGGDDG